VLRLGDDGLPRFDRVRVGDVLLAIEPVARPQRGAAILTDPGQADLEGFAVRESPPAPVPPAALMPMPPPEDPAVDFARPMPAVNTDGGFDLHDAPRYAPPAPLGPTGTAMMDAEADTLDAQLIPASITIDPGGSGHVTLEIINQGRRADRFVVTPLDIPRDWVTTLPSHSIDVRAGGSATAVIVLHPPRASRTTAGQFPYALSIHSLKSRDRAAVVQGEVVILPYHAYEVRLRPTRIVSGRRAMLVISNQSNAPAQFEIAARAASPDVQFELDSPRVVVPAGGRANVPLRAILARGGGLRRRDPVRFVIEVTSPDMLGFAAGGTVPVREVGGEVVPPDGGFGWLVAAAFGLLLIGISAAVALLVFARVEFGRQVGATATIVELGLRQAATATAVASLDSDDDGLTDLEEAALGTDPNNPDTDGDGLSDFTEVRVTGTDPLKVDTDGDTLSDREEIDRYGTDPLNPDTDGDGLTDGQEVGETFTNPLIPDAPGVFYPGAALDASQPDVAVRQYYEAVNARQYAATYPLITDAFRASTSTTTFELYAAWWDRVARIEIGAIRLIDQTPAEAPTRARVYAELTYHLVDGRALIDHHTTVYLLRDAPGGAWRIDAKLTG
jgi:hypothetical protein